jgi:hypothetical protein
MATRTPLTVICWVRLGKDTDRFGLAGIKEEDEALQQIADGK